MSNYNISYSNMPIAEKEKIIRELYVRDKKSFADIAELYQTYPNKIRRDAVSLNIPIRGKSEAQKNALKTGKHKHPTKGKERSVEDKKKIGLGVLQSWDSLSKEELESRKLKSKEVWDKLDDEAKKQLTSLANKAVRESSKQGSKLEKFLLAALIQDGYKVEFHKEQALSNTKLQIDLFLPSMNTAIEVDGPSHFLPVWGEDTLSKNIAYDQKKQGLITGKGLVLIRIKQKKDFSKTRSELIYNDLKIILDKINQKFPSSNDRTFIIED